MLLQIRYNTSKQHEF